MVSMIQVSRSGPGNFFKAVAMGRVTRRDCREIFSGTFASTIKSKGRIRLCYVLDRDFRGLTWGALLTQVAWTVLHGRSFDAIAVVTNSPRRANVTGFLSFFLSCPINIFGEEKDAAAWVASSRRWDIPSASAKLAGLAGPLEAGSLCRPDSHNLS